jgi:amino acid transporter
MNDSHPAPTSSPDDVRLHPPRALSLFDAIAISVGIIIGSAIYESSPRVAENAAGWLVGKLAPRPVQAGGSSPESTSHGDRVQSDAAPRTAAVAPATHDSAARLAAYSAGLTLAVWVAGGLLALVGALCVAELATTWPQAGGPYVYLSETLGRGCGFAYAWVEFWIVRPGNLGAVAFVLAKYALAWEPAASSPGTLHPTPVACLAIVGLSLVNAAGLRAGKRAQNVLTAAKVAGLAGVFVVSLFSSAPASPVTPTLPAEGSLALALILVMFAYGGWADISLVAAEVRQPQRNLLRALVGGTVLVALIYVCLNAAFLRSLGVTGMIDSRAVAADILELRMGALGRQAISLLVVVSCLGALNGMLLSGARVPYALGRHHPTFQWLGQWHLARGVPLRSLVGQTAVTLGLIAAFGRDARSFERLVVFTAPFYWGFIALVGAALLVRRWKLSRPERSFRVPLYPLTPIIFMASSAWMAWAACRYAWQNWSVAGWWTVAVLVSGLAVSAWDRRHRAAAGSPTS